MDGAFPQPGQHKPPMETLAHIPPRKLVEAVRRAVERLAGSPVHLVHYAFAISPNTLQVRFTLDWSDPELEDLFSTFAALAPVKLQQAVKETLEELAGAELELTHAEFRLADDELELELDFDDPSWLAL